MIVKYLVYSTSRWVPIQPIQQKLTVPPINFTFSQIFKLENILLKYHILSVFKQIQISSEKHESLHKERIIK